MAADWDRFSSQWASNEVATDLEDKSAAKRAAAFLACVGTEAYEAFHTMPLDGSRSREHCKK